MSLSRKHLKYVLVGFVSTVIVLTGLVSFAADHLGTAYIRPRTLVYAQGNFWVYADNAFNEEQRQLIRTASIKLHDRMRTQRSRILDCAYKRSSNNRPSSRQAIDNQLVGTFVNAASGNRPIKLTVTRMWSEPRYAGLAPVGGFPEKGDLFRIALNSDDLGSNAQYFLKTNTDYWAGVMVHEVLHNLGYNHPSPSNGSFIKEFGRCTQYVGNVPADFNLTGGGQEKEE